MKINVINVKNSKVTINTQLTDNENDILSFKLKANFTKELKHYAFHKWMNRSLKKLKNLNVGGFK